MPWVISVVIFMQSMHIAYYISLGINHGHTAGFGAMGTPQLQHRIVA